MGKVFWAGALEAIGERDAQAVKAGLHELSRAELVRPARQSKMAGQAEYSFWHALVRDAAYGQIPRTARAAKHEAAARWMESQAAERLDDLAEVLAHHYLQARELFLAAGQPDEAARLDDPARRFLTVAGDRALSLDVAKAEAHYAQALALAPPGNPERPALLVQAAEAAGEAGRYADSAALLEEAVAGFREQDDRCRTGQALHRLARVSYRMGEAAFDELLAEALTLLEAEPAGPELVDAYASQAAFDFLRGRTDAAIQSAQRVVALAQELGVPEPARALGYLAFARCQLGDTGGVEDGRRALELALEQGLGREAGILYNNLGLILWPVEGPAAALGLWQEGIAFAERRGIGEVALAIAVSSLPVRFDLGDWELLADEATRLGARAEASRSHLPLLEARSVEARVLASRGRLEQAGELADWLLPAAREYDHQEALFLALSVAVLVELGRADGRGRSAAFLTELVELALPRYDAYYAALLPEHVRMALAAGEPAVAERLLEDVAPITPRHELALRTADALLAEAAGEFERAASLYAEAAARWQRPGVVPEVAQALLGEGRCRLALGRPEAAASLARARELFHSLGAQPLLAETSRLLEQAQAVMSPARAQSGRFE